MHDIDRTATVQRNVDYNETSGFTIRALIDHNLFFLSFLAMHIAFSLGSDG